MLAAHPVLLDRLCSSLSLMSLLLPWTLAGVAAPSFIPIVHNGSVPSIAAPRHAVMNSLASVLVVFVFADVASSRASLLLSGKGGSWDMRVDIFVGALGSAVVISFAFSQKWARLLVVLILNCATCAGNSLFSLIFRSFRQVLALGIDSIRDGPHKGPLQQDLLFSPLLPLPFVPC